MHGSPGLGSRLRQGWTTTSCAEVVFAWRLSWEGNNLLQIEKLLDRALSALCRGTFKRGQRGLLIHFKPQGEMKKRHLVQNETIETISRLFEDLGLRASCCVLTLDAGKSRFETH